MFGPNQIPRTFGFTKILNGINRSLNFANQVIPIYEQAKPLLSNARGMMRMLKEFAHSDIPIKKENTLPNKKNTPIKTITNMSNPVFFQ